MSRRLLLINYSNSDAFSHICSWIGKRRVTLRIFDTDVQRIQNLSIELEAKSKLEVDRS